MATDAPGSDWKSLDTDPRVRLRAVREYAATVFGKEIAAAAWMGRVTPAVRDGSCTVAEACQTLEGFLEAMFELARLSRKLPMSAGDVPVQRESSPAGAPRPGR